MVPLCEFLDMEQVLADVSVIADGAQPKAVMAAQIAMSLLRNFRPDKAPPGYGFAELGIALHPDYKAVDGVPLAWENLTALLGNPLWAGFYIVANLALGTHLFHGVWSLFQSLGWNNPRFSKWRRHIAGGVSSLIVVGNVSFPIAVLTHIVKVKS